MKSNGFFQSFRCACRGVVSCVRQERNFRIHLTAVCYTAALGLRLGLGGAAWAVLFLTQALVLAAELINTAVEAAVDLCCPQRHRLAKRAKDAAAGAVLVCAVFSVAVGFCLFWKPELWALAAAVLASPRALFILLASAAASVWFICAFKEK